jgi:hypothetical protein
VLSRKEPKELAVRIAASILYHMETWREQAAEMWGVDIADPQGLGGSKARSFVENLSLLRKANCYRAYEECLRKLGAYAADPSLSHRELTFKVCEVGIEALQTLEAVLLHTLR